MMKNQTSNPTYNRSSFHLLIKEEHSIIKSDSLIDAHSLALCGVRPEVVQNSIKGIQARYASLLAKIKSSLQGATEKAFGQLDQQHADMETNKNNATLQRLKEEVRVDEADLRKMRLGYDWTQYHWRLFLEVIIFGGEVSFNSYAFSVLGGSLLFAILPAVVFAIALALAAYFIPRYVKSLPERADRIRAAVTLALLMFSVFLAIGILRSIAALGNGTLHTLSNKSVMAGALIFTLLNFFMFCAAMVLSWGLPSKQDRLSKNEHDKLTKQIKTAKQEIARLEKENSVIATTLNSTKRGRMQTVGEEAHFENLVKQCCDETCHAFYAEFAIKSQRGSDNYLNGPENL